ncbi:MAG: hypothetical protein K2H82_03575 [Oscillospiraceae bacterium]|nr:hypothetical protein [Oscillospiraceae bacterium]
MKKFILQMILLSVFDFVSLFLLTSALQIYVLLWLIVWTILWVQGKELFLVGLLATGLIYILGSRPYGNLPALALWYIPIGIFLYCVRKEEKENFIHLLCFVVPSWMGIACAVTACAGWTMDCLNGANAVLGMWFLLITLCQAVCAGLLN